MCNIASYLAENDLENFKNSYETVQEKLSNRDDLRNQILDSARERNSVRARKKIPHRAGKMIPSRKEIPSPGRAGRPSRPAGWRADRLAVGWQAGEQARWPASTPSPAPPPPLIIL